MPFRHAKVVVYTVVIGNYDMVRSPLTKIQGWSYLSFTTRSQCGGLNGRLPRSRGMVSILSSAHDFLKCVAVC